MEDASLLLTGMFRRHARSIRLWTGLCGLLAVFNTGRAEAAFSDAHPRLWLTPERLQRLRACAAENTERWIRLKEVADDAVNGTDATYEHIAALALVYQVTGVAVYSQKAIEIALSEAVPENRLTEDDYYFYRDALPAVSIALDWLYDQMSASQRTQIATWLMDRADQCWPETNPARSEGWAIDNPSNNYYSGYLMTWPAALAAYGEDNRAASHISLAVNRYRTQVRPYLQSWGRGGVMAESTNYDSTFRYALILDGHRTATGEDFLNDPDCGFFADSLYWRIHSTTPSWDAYYPLGDQTRISHAPLSEFDRMRALIPLDTAGDSNAALFAQSWLDTIDPNTSDHWFAIPWEVLYYHENLHSAAQIDSLPLWYFASGPGLLVQRTSWTPEATYWGIWSGPYREAHQNADVNGFLIYKGGWLVGNTTIWSYSGDFSATIYQNNVTIGGVGQEGQTPDTDYPEEAGTVLKLEVAEDYSLFEGQGAQAYTVLRNYGGKPQVQDYVRKFVNLGENLFMVYDRITTVNPNAPKEWHLHSATDITQMGRGYWFDNNNYLLYGQTLLPEQGVTISSAPERYGYNNSKSSVRLDVAVNNGTATDTILNVLQIEPIDGPVLPDAVAIQAESGNMEGALCGGWVVLFGTSERVSSPVVYTFESTRPTSHLVADMLPNTNYQVVWKNVRTGETGARSVPASESGCLRFEVPAGLIQVSASVP